MADQFIYHLHSTVSSWQDERYTLHSELTSQAVNQCTKNSDIARTIENQKHKKWNTESIALATDEEQNWALAGMLVKQQTLT